MKTNHPVKSIDDGVTVLSPPPPPSSSSTPQGCERRHTHEDKLEHNMLGCTTTNRAQLDGPQTHWQRWSALCSFTNFCGFTDFSNFAFRTNLWTAGNKVSSYWSRGKKNSEIYLTFCYETCNPLKQCAHFTETHSFSYTANVTGGEKRLQRRKRGYFCQNPIRSHKGK